MKKSPLQEVRERFEDKLKLAEALMGKLERPYEESDEEFARRVRTMSNKKLLRLHSAHEKVEADFSGKAGLIDAIMTLRTGQGKPDEQFRAKLESYRVTRLLDIHRSHSIRTRNAARKAARQAARAN